MTTSHALITVQPTASSIAAVRSAVDSHFDPMKGLIAFLILGISLFAYMRLLGNPRK